MKEKDFLRAVRYADRRYFRMAELRAEQAAASEARPKTERKIPMTTFMTRMIAIGAGAAVCGSIALFTLLPTGTDRNSTAPLLPAGSTPPASLAELYKEPDLSCLSCFGVDIAQYEYRGEYIQDPAVNYEWLGAGEKPQYRWFEYTNKSGDSIVLDNNCRVRKIIFPAPANPNELPDITTEDDLFAAGQQMLTQFVYNGKGHLEDHGAEIYDRITPAEENGSPDAAALLVLFPQNAANKQNIRKAIIEVNAARKLRYLELDYEPSLPQKTVEKLNAAIEKQFAQQIDARFGDKVESYEAPEGRFYLIDGKAYAAYFTHVRLKDDQFYFQPESSIVYLFLSEDDAEG